MSNNLTPIQRQWLEQIEGLIGPALTAQNQIKTRAQIAAQVASELHVVKHDIQQSHDLALTLLHNRKKTIRTMGNNAIESFDTIADLSRIASMDPGAYQNLMRATGHIEKLRAKFCDTQPPPTSQDIADQFYQPLIREGLIPENAVPDPYSKVQMTFDSACRGYQERLLDFSQELAAQTPLERLLAHSQTIKSGSGAALDKATTALGKFAPIDEDAAQTIKNGITIAIEGGLSVAQARVAHSKSQLIDAVAQTLMKGFGEGNERLASIVSAAYGNARATARGLKSLARGDAQGALEAFGEAIVESLALCDVAQNDDRFKVLGQRIKQGFATTQMVARLAHALKQQENTDEMIQVLLLASGKALSALHSHLKPAPQEDDEEEDDEEQDEPDEDEIQNAFIEIAEQLDSRAIDDIARMQKTQEEHRAQEDQEIKDRAFQHLLANGIGLGRDAQADAAGQELLKQASIEALIAQIKKDQATLKTIQTIIASGITVASQFYEALNAAGYAKAFLFEAMDAINRAKQYNAMMDSLRDATASASVYGEAITNLSRNTKIHLTSAMIHMVCDAAKLAGAVITVAGVTAPIGTAIVKSAQTAQKICDYSKRAVTEAQMILAWRTYKQALAQKGNRKLIRKALRENPTLAKYAMAYGGLVEKNPVMMNLLNKIGLTDRFLTDPHADTHKVVMLLELIFADDPVLLRAIPIPMSWHPPIKLELTLATWLTYYHTALKDTKPALQKGGIGSINGAITRLEKAHATITAAGGDRLAPRAAVQEAITCLQNLQKELNAYTPRQDKGETHADMASVIDTLMGMAEQREKALTARLQQDTFLNQEGVLESEL
ncbi:MAG: hypothetical protein AAF442_01395 [Pseudomonadota bacterium]